MTAQTFFQLMLALGIILSAVGGYFSFYFERRQAEEDRFADKRTQDALRGQIEELQKSFDEKTTLIFQALNVKPDEWMEVELKHVPGGVADYLLLLFKSDKGRISGKVRIKGGDKISHFSTTANDKVPVAVPNLWLPKQQKYQEPTIMEFAVTDKTAPDATLSIFTQGWIDTRGREPH